MVLPFDIQVVNETRGVIKSKSAAAALGEVEMETEREDIALEILLIRHDRMRIGLERGFDDAAACIPRLEKEVAVAHPVPCPEVFSHGLRDGRMLSGIQGGLGLFSCAKTGRKQQVAKGRDVGHVGAAQYGSRRRDEISRAGPGPIGGRCAENAQVVTHRLVDERKQDVVSLSLNKPAEREKLHPTRPP